MVRQEASPSTLYKYRRVGEFTDAILTDRQVYLATADDLNDPFECSIQEIASDWVDKTVREMQSAQLQGFVMVLADAMDSGRPVGMLLRQQIRGILEGFKGLNHDAAYERFQTWSRHAFGSRPSDPGAPFRHMDRDLHRVGIFSLSEDPAHPLMWSHYGGEGRGVALGFGRPDGSKLAGDACVRVNYSDELPAFSGGLIVRAEYAMTLDGLQTTQRVGLWDPTFRLAASTKSVHWSYEREWRYLEPTGGPFPAPGPLVEVVFGVRCDVADRAHIRELLDSSTDRIQLSEIQRIPNTNAVRKVPLEF